MLGYHLFQTKGFSCSCEEPIWLRSKFHNQNCNSSFKVFKISRIETRRFLVPSICGTNIKIGYRVHVFFLKACGSRQTWQTSVHVTWMGNFFWFLQSKQEPKLGFCFFCRPLCMPGRIVTCLLGHVSSQKALEKFDTPKEYIAFWS
jgi:hypothetical protein